MKRATLADDLGALAAGRPPLLALAQAIVRPGADADLLPARVAEFGIAAGLGAFGTTALLLKADWQAQRTGETWCPWESEARYAVLLAPLAAPVPACPLALLLLEASALDGHRLPAADSAVIGAHHARVQAVLAAAPADVQQRFAAGRRDWLLLELQAETLLEQRREVVDATVSARIAYLTITGRSYALLVAAAHELAIWRYRRQLDDITLTAEEAELRLTHDLDGSEAAFEPALRLALLDTVRRVRADHEAMRRLARLYMLGQAEVADDDEQDEAVYRYKQLAAKVHPDSPTRLAVDGQLHERARARLDEIWTAASATYHQRVQLSKDKLQDWRRHLDEWHDEVDRILRHAGCALPSRLAEGDSPEALLADVQRAIERLQPFLDGLRDDIAALQLDPQAAEYRRVVALGDEARAAECAAMEARAAAWRAEAARIEHDLLAAGVAAAAADAALLKRERG